LVDAYAEPADDAAMALAASTFGECALLGSIVARAVPQLDLSEDAIACLDENGRADVEDLFAKALREQPLGIPSVVLQCLSPDELDSAADEGS